METINFRMSTQEDYDGVVNILSDSEFGRGVMAEIYPSLMSDSSFYGAVGEAGGEIVAFGGAYVTLGGKKLFSFGGRVHESWRGFGVYKKLKEFLRNRLKQGPCPDLAYEEFVTHGDNVSLDTIFKSTSYRHIFTAGLLYLKIISRDMVCSLDENHPSMADITIEEIGLDGLRQVLADPVTRGRIFPRRLLVGFKMFDPEVSEVDLMAQTSPPVVASYSNKCARTISTGGHHGSNSYIIQFHFDTELSPPEVSEHFVLHFREHVHLGMKDAEVCVVVVPEGTISDTFDKIVFYGLERMKMFERALGFAFSRKI